MSPPRGRSSRSDVLEPIPDAPAAIAAVDGQRLLVVADVHAGIEAEYRREGVELADGSTERRERLVGLLDAHEPDRLVIAGDLGTTIGRPRGAEREEITALLEACTDRVPVTVVPGNHDGDLAAVVEDSRVTIADASGVTVGGLGICHGHTWPGPAVLRAETVALGHEHPRVRLRDAVGGGRVERVWLRGWVDPDPLRERGFDPDPGLRAVVLPAYNDRSGGTPLNGPDRSYLSPLLAAALRDAEAFLLDGTRLGPLAEL